MVKKDVKVKEYINIEEKVIITNHLIDSYFVKSLDGIIEYTPYMADVALVTAFFLYCINGIEFDEEENIYNSVIADEELMDMYTTTLSVKLDDDNHPNIKLIREINSIMRDVADMVEFRKQQIIHDNSILNDKLIEILDMQKEIETLRLEIAQNENRVLQQQYEQNAYNEKVMSHMTPEETAELNRKMLNEDMDFSKLAELVTEKFIHSDTLTSNIVDMKTSPKKKPGRPKKSVNGTTKKEAVKK